MLFFCALLCSLGALAAETLRMQTSTGNAEVYDQPSFSGKVLARLKAQTIINVNAKKIVGPDGIGAFYEFKSNSGKTVYINDSLLNLAPAPVAKAPAPAPVVKAAPKAPIVKAPAPAAPVALAPVPVAPVAVAPVVREPIVNEPPDLVEQALPPQTDASRGSKLRLKSESYMGLNLGVINYAEKYNETRYQASRASFGFRHQAAMGSSRILGTEFNLLFSPGAPKFLIDAGASGSSGGYLLIGDYQFVGRWAMTKNFQAKLGGGLAIINSKFNTTLITEPYTTESTRAGAALTAGVAYTAPTWAFVLDVRQFVEKESYLGSQVSFLIPL